MVLLEGERVIRGTCSAKFKLCFRLLARFFYDIFVVALMLDVAFIVDTQLRALLCCALDAPN